jgi:hypothetical protein
MANHSYVHYNRKRVTLTIEAVEMLLKEFCLERFGDKVVVERQEEAHQGRHGDAVWHCIVPGSEISDAMQAGHRLMAPGEPCGFPVWFRPGLLEFRHRLNYWERWAQTCIEEDFAMHTHGTMTSDHDDKKEPAHRMASEYKTLRAYLLRNFPKHDPLTKADADWIEPIMEMAPECFRG